MGGLTVLALVLWTLNLLAPVSPSTWWAEMDYRMRMAQAVVAVTGDPEEQLTLMTIPRWESNYREDVGQCLVVGPQGEVTAWQILPRSKAERELLCVTMEADARVALARVRESVRTCRHLAPELRLALYARGRCSSVDGQRFSRHRYPGRRAVDLFARLFTTNRQGE